MLKIVDFEKWCKSCIHDKEKEVDEPCNTCLMEPVNEDSRKPVYWKENEQATLKGAKDVVR